MNKTDREKIYTQVMDLRKDNRRLKNTLEETTKASIIKTINDLMYQNKVRIRFLIATSKN